MLVGVEADAVGIVHLDLLERELAVRRRTTGCARQCSSQPDVIEGGFACPSFRIDDDELRAVAGPIAIPEALGITDPFRIDTHAKDEFLDVPRQERFGAGVVVAGNGWAGGRHRCSLVHV